MAVGGAFMVSDQHTANLAQQKGALSAAQMKKMLAQKQTYQQQMQHMVAEATRRETKERQARIAAAARTYQEQADRQRAAQEKLAAERAAADRVRETQEAKRAAERQKAAEEKQKEEMQITAAKEHVLAVERRLWRFRHRYARAQRYNHQCEQEKHSRSIGHDVRISKSNCRRKPFPLAFKRKAKI